MDPDEGFEYVRAFGATYNGTTITWARSATDPDTFVQAGLQPDLEVQINAMREVEGTISPRAPSATQLRKGREKEALKGFIATGIPTDIMPRYNNGRLEVSRNGRLLFVIQGDKMVVVKNNTTHLRKMLEKLAEREGLRHTVLDKVRANGGNYVAFWAWQGQPEVDDSDMVKAMGIEPSPIRDRDLGDHCDDPDCPTCDEEMPF